MVTSAPIVGFSHGRMYFSMSAAGPVQERCRHKSGNIKLLDWADFSSGHPDGEWYFYQCLDCQEYFETDKPIHNGN